MRTMVTALVVSCDKCRKRIIGHTFSVPPPFGTLNARMQVELCHACFIDYGLLGWTWLDRAQPAALAESMRCETGAVCACREGEKE
jgi:hypothetical protein